MQENSIHEIVREAEQNLIIGTTKTGEYVDWSLHETTERIFAYLNSRHTTGSTDSLGRDKPFFNIVSAAVNIWYRATDLDRKDVVVLPNNRSTVAGAFLATALLQDWMKRVSFGVFLNKWGRTLAQYGSAVVKFVEQDGELHCSVVPWNRMIVDPIDFNALPRIEKFYKTPTQLKNMATKGHPDYAGYNLEVVDSLMSVKQSRETLDRQRKDDQSDFIELYEVHGELSEAVYKLGKDSEADIADKDNENYFQQMHVVCWAKGKDGKDVDFTLYCGKEKQDPYMLTHLIEEEGRTLAIGAVEYLFDAQWMTNHTMKQWKDQLDISSKLVFQTADQNFIGRNILTNIETGDILVRSPNAPLEMLPNTGHDITNLQGYANQWRMLGNELTSTPESTRGITPPSGTALGTVQIVTAQGLSLFEIMTENKGHDLEAMLRERVIPHLKTKMNTTEEIVAILDDANITKLDAMYVPKAAIRNYNQKLVQEVLKLTPEDVANGQTPAPFDKTTEEKEISDGLAELGNQRFLSPGQVTWNEVLKDLEWKLDVQITNEQHDKQVVAQTLTELLKTIATNPLVLQDQNAKLLFNKILGITGQVSPLELATVSAQPNPQALQELAINK